YFQWQEPITKIAGHRLLALLRGETEKMLSLSIRPDEQTTLAELTRHWLKPSPHREQLLMAIEDGYKRLLAPSLENEIRQELKDRADREAIAVFADNLRHLLLAPPLGQKRVMALDPGFRTGAKLVCLDGQGRLLHATTIYPTQGEKQRSAAALTVRELADTYRIEAIAIGSGTAGRETEAFIRALGLDQHIMVTLVNEDGASIYSASEIARREFPDQDLTVRGAVSIGRRLQDPLAELVKIDPKSIGIGQYQHDVDQVLLKASLADVVASCVNSVGVEVNSASAELLTHVSGIGPTLAANIVGYRDQHGPFRSRRELLKVPRLGAKAFEQAAGFLRISEGDQPLDASAVHPERYRLVEQMAADLGATVADLLASPSLRESIDVTSYRSEAVGLPTLTDIMEELAKPGRDPRRQFQSFRFAEGINQPADLQPGMVVPAIITNVTTFGAFADIGVHRDGLIHVSQLADSFVADPATVVRVRQQVQVRVLEVDLDRQRISLSMKGLQQPNGANKR
ncbi:MAG: helix-hairpin-helix domain-containing protein, partial [Desulfofustis sp.]|nr:helix-hairpin-helix domain-containing protein [Desulfofustis sp.]